MSTWLVTGSGSDEGSLLTDSLHKQRVNGSTGGFFRSPADTELWGREKQASDGATLSVNGIAIHVLHELAMITGNQPLIRFFGHVDVLQPDALHFMMMLHTFPAFHGYILAHLENYAEF
ncbi:MAG: hypothetical protein KAJ06_05265 [Gammaproteobacteria bacterium]|nr:hypothetical protein [Gammaproteobacteria bacterium]